MTTQILLKAPAKLTWNLSVRNRRSDGLHEIESEMVSLSLADDIIVTPGGHGLSIREEGVSAALVPTTSDNLVSRALALAGINAGIHIVKRIPVGGGLGGGSSDAAAVLRWAGWQDLETAAHLGSDVPYCMTGGRAVVSGVGNVVEPLRHLERKVVLCLVPLSVNTGAVYQAFDELVREGTLRRNRNDLTDAAFLVEPRLQQVARELERRTQSAVHLAGSGSTLFLEGTKAELGMGNETSFTVDGLECRLVECFSVRREELR